MSYYLNQMKDGRRIPGFSPHIGQLGGYIMTRFLSALGAAILVSAPAAHAQSAGDIAAVTQRDWVTVKNLEPVHNQNAHHKPGELCSINRGGSLSMVGSYNEENALLKYMAPPVSLGRDCPSGTIFLMAKGAFRQLIEQHNASEKAEKDERATIANMLKTR